MGSGFHLEVFLSGALMTVILPTSIALFSLSRFKISSIEKKSHSLFSLQRTPEEGNLTNISAASISLVLGFCTAAVWFSWSAEEKSRSFGPSGPPTGYPVWQVVCASLTLLIISLWLTKKCREIFYGSIVVALLLASGVAIALAIGTSFGVQSQNGIEVIISYLGCAIVLSIFNIILSSVELIRNRTTG